MSTGTGDAVATAFFPMTAARTREATVANLAPFTFPDLIKEALARNKSPNVPPAMIDALEPDLRYPIEPPIVENAAMI